MGLTMNAKEESYLNSEYGKRMQEHNRSFSQSLHEKKLTPDVPEHHCYECAVCYGTDTVFDFYRCQLCGFEWESLPL